MSLATPPTPVRADIEGSDIKDRALSRAVDLGSLPGSIEDGAGNMAGLLGEEAFCEVFNADLEPTYDWDARIALLDGTERTVDIKTKRRTVDPRPGYEVSIADRNTEQDADLYYFVSVNTETDTVTLCGYLPTAEYFDKAEFHAKGEVDPDNGFTFAADCYNVPIRDLRQFAVGRTEVSL